MSQLKAMIEALRQEQVIAYPTEAVFGLGCNPQSETAVRRLLALKQRPEEKGLILIAPTVELLLPFIDESKLDEQAWQRFQTISEQAITWLMPAKTSVPRWLKGQFDTIAVRLCPVPAVQKLCDATGFALTSTSANLTGEPPCRTFEEVKDQFGQDFPVFEEVTLGRTNPSEIRDIFTQAIVRAG